MNNPWNPQIIKINLSSTFIVKNRCCFECGKTPIEYFWINLSPYYYDPRSAHHVFDLYKKYIKRMTGSWYVKQQPRLFKSIKNFNFYWLQKSYKVALHQHFNIEATVHVIEYLVCPCGRTIWAFNQKDTEERPEIKNRKARSTYPLKFESF